MILDIIVISNFLKNKTEQILKGVFLIRRHITPNSLISLIKHPLKARINFARLVHGKSDGIHFQIDGKLVCLLAFGFGVFELDEVVALVFDKSDDAFGESELEMGYIMERAPWMIL
jgi:hypothetical protein